jgi:anti-sigma B factor antagonist
MPFALESEQAGGFTILAVLGEVDIASSPALRRRLGQLLAADQHLIVDLCGVEFMDSTGLGVLVGGRNKAMQVGASFSLVCDQLKVLNLFKITGLADVFTIHSTLSNAIAAQRA